MPIDILMPALSPTMKRGRLARWIKEEGSKVEPGEVIAEIETDKAIMELEAIDFGVLFKILVKEGTENVPVNAKIAILLEEGEVFEERGYENSEKLMREREKILPDLELGLSSVVNEEFFCEKEEIGAFSDRIFASPLARRLANEHAISLSSCKGTGPKGRIIKSDVSTFIKTLEDTDLVTQKTDFAPKKLLVHTPMRRAIAQKMSLSKGEIPHFYLSIRCNVDSLLLLRTSINDDLKSKISIGDFVLKAAAYALKRVPLINSSWSEEGVMLHENIDVCVAVGLDEGLITPIIFETDKKNLLQISSEVRELAEKAREKKLMPQDYQGGSFTVSNLGMYGISDFSAIINYPQSAILAVGAVFKEVCVSQNGDGFEARSLMKVTLSCDHRVIDGTVGAQWLKEFKDLIERPLQLMF